MDEYRQMIELLRMLARSGEVVAEDAVQRGLSDVPLATCLLARIGIPLELVAEERRGTTVLVVRLLKGGRKASCRLLGAFGLAVGYYREEV